MGHRALQPFVSPLLLTSRATSSQTVLRATPEATREWDHQGNRALGNVASRLLLPTRPMIDAGE